MFLQAGSYTACSQGLYTILKIFLSSHTVVWDSEAVVLLLESSEYRFQLNYMQQIDLHVGSMRNHYAVIMKITGPLVIIITNHNTGIAYFTSYQNLRGDVPFHNWGHRWKNPSESRLTMQCSHSKTILGRGLGTMTVYISIMVLYPFCQPRKSWTI